MDFWARGIWLPSRVKDSDALCRPHKTGALRTPSPEIRERHTKAQKALSLQKAANFQDKGRDARQTSLPA